MPSCYPTQAPPRGQLADFRKSIMLEIHDVVKTYGKNAPAVADVSLNLSLHDHAHRPAAAFSGDMRRRLGIAQALR